MTVTLTEQSYETTTDKTQAKHIVMTPPGEPDQTPQAYVLRAQVEGFPVIALCGYAWVPHRDPRPLPICSECKEIFEHDPHGHGDRDELPDA